MSLFRIQFLTTCLFCTLTVFAQSESLDTTVQEERAIYKVRFVDEVPRFPGCEEIEGKEERQYCANQKMMEYLFEESTLKF